MAAAVADASASGATVEEVVVTSQRRDESIQKVPMTVQAFTGDTLSKLNITSLEGVLKYTPNVTFGNNGPGQGNIFIRGLSAGFAGNQSSATAGNFPNVAIYLDDTSMQFPARNVDIYAVDLERIEVLEGPQGTLFGGGAEAGAVRYITNKPKLNVFSARAEASYGFTAHGDPNNSENFTINLPVITDKLAVRLSIYNDRRGGYIDNVPSTFTRANSDLGNSYFNLKPNSQGVCPNGLPAAGSPFCTLASSPQANNASVVQKAQNPTTYSGLRASAVYEVNDDWNILITQTLARLDAQGLSADYPIGSDFQLLKPLEVTAFSPSYDKDNWENTSWTVNGKFAGLKLIYTGSYMERKITQQTEYSNYSRTAGGMYYQCSGPNVAAGGGFGNKGAGTDVCYSPVGYWQDTVRNTHMTHEIRVNTPDTGRIRAIGGLFYEQFKIYDVQNFNYKTLPACSPANLAIALASPANPICVANVATSPGSTATVPGIRADNTAFGEDAQRGYDQFAAFGSVDFEIIPNVLTITGGTRYYNYSEYETGSQYGTGTGCQNIPNGCTSSNVNIDNAHDQKVYQGFKSRATLTWQVNADTRTYFLFSQGFRPGGFNRSSSSVAPFTTVKSTAQFRRPISYAPDSLDNYEIGLKTQIFEHRLQLNLSAYYMQWKNVQYLFFNPTQLGNTTFGVNGPDFNIKGVEGQFVAKPIDGLTLQGSASYNQNKQANSPCLVANIAQATPGAAAVGQCITTVKNVPFQNPFGIAGATAPFSPEFEGNISALYEWNIGALKAHARVGGNYIGTEYNQPATYTSGENVLIPNTTYLRYRQPGYGTIDAAFGIATDHWAAEIFGSNLANSHASTFTSSAQFIKSEVPIRPRVVGMKISANF